MPDFIPALELNRRFYFECIRPSLDIHYPNLPHAAALIGYGSETLGFDSEMSMDHNWFPRGYLILQENDRGLIDPIRETLRRELPHEFLGFPVDTIPAPDEPSTRWMKRDASGLVEHMVVPITLRDFALENMGWDLTEPLTSVDWLTFPSQVLLAMTSGAVYFDNVGEVTRFRETLSWYPHDVWLFLMASVWGRIGQEEHLMPRAGYSGDELGSALIGSRLIRDIMSLCFLMEKKYAPYPKWFGSGFKQLACASEFSSILWDAQLAEDWKQREQALCKAYELLIRKHNLLGITEPLSDRVSSFHGRPFKVIHGDAVAQAIAKKISDSAIRQIAEKGLIGGIDQLSDNSEIRSNPNQWRPSIKSIYMN